jgi:hypothetical protein
MSIAKWKSTFGGKKVSAQSERPPERIPATFVESVLPTVDNLRCAKEAWCF